MTTVTEREISVAVIPAQVGTKFIFVEKNGKAVVHGNVLAFHVTTEIEDGLLELVIARAVGIYSESPYSGVMYPDGSVDIDGDGCFDSLEKYQEFLNDIPDVL